MHFWTLRLSDL